MVVLALMGFVGGAVSLYAQRRDTLESRKEKVRDIVRPDLASCSTMKIPASQGKLPWRMPTPEAKGCAGRHALQAR